MVVSVEYGTFGWVNEMSIGPKKYENVGILSNLLNKIVFSDFFGKNENIYYILIFKFDIKSGFIFVKKIIPKI